MNFLGVGSINRKQFSWFLPWILFSREYFDIIKSIKSSGNLSISYLYTEHGCRETVARAIKTQFEWLDGILQDIGNKQAFFQSSTQPKGGGTRLHVSVTLTKEHNSFLRMIWDLKMWAADVGQIQELDLDWVAKFMAQVSTWKADPEISAITAIRVNELDGTFQSITRLLLRFLSLC